MGTRTYTRVAQYFIQDDPEASEQEFGGVLIIRYKYEESLF